MKELYTDKVIVLWLNLNGKTIGFYHQDNDYKIIIILVIVWYDEPGVTVTRGRVASYVSVVVHSAASLPRFATAMLRGTMAESVQSRVHAGKHQSFFSFHRVSQARQSGLLYHCDCMIPIGPDQIMSHLHFHNNWVRLEILRNILRTIWLRIHFNFQFSQKAKEFIVPSYVCC